MIAFPFKRRLGLLPLSSAIERCERTWGVGEQRSVGGPCTTVGLWGRGEKLGLVRLVPAANHPPP